jgi:hypothetical protein
MAITKHTQSRDFSKSYGILYAVKKGIELTGFADINTFRTKEQLIHIFKEKLSMDIEVVEIKLNVFRITSCK